MLLYLAVNVSVDDPNEWIHGPEYVFQANMTYLLFPDLVKEPHRRISEILFVKCRPQAPESLLCFLKGDGIDSSNEDLSSEESPIKSSLDMPFLIEFSPRGVEHLRLMYVMDKLDLYFIRSIAKQLSVGADLRGNANALFGFEAKENYVFGECSTFFRTVEYDKDKDRPMKGIKERWNYDIQLLPLNRSRTDSVFVIEKTTESKRCVKAKDPGYRPQDVNVRWKSVYSLVIQISIGMKIRIVVKCMDSFCYFLIFPFWFTGGIN